MYTNDYDFAGVNAVKILFVNNEGKILLTQEPENFAWMPLHWGLPGGKATKKLPRIKRGLKTKVGR